MKRLTSGILSLLPTLFWAPQPPSLEFSRDFFPTLVGLLADRLTRLSWADPRRANLAAVDSMAKDGPEVIEESDSAWCGLGMHAGPTEIFAGNWLVRRSAFRDCWCREQKQGERCSALVFPARPEFGG